MKKIIVITLWIVMFAGTMVIFGFAVAEQKKVTCTGATIILQDDGKPGFINETDIRKIISTLYNPLEGRCLDSINTQKIAEKLIKNPYINYARVIKALSGQIKVELKRSKALVRVINQQGTSFYLGHQGEALPTSQQFIPKTLVATGYITDAPDLSAKFNYDPMSNPLQANSLLSRIYLLASEINQHNLLKESIGQIYVNRQKEFELVPSSGNHVILIGNGENLEHKFENLLAFYQAGMNKIKPEDYNIIDLRYKDLVYCKKSNQ
ncbi:MAG TPA: hypothetical protein PK915_02335 [Bacteroidales bacterium]|nr:hypothetical protein [Bacteroidales bacterium]